jgi:hypothetical protein
MMIAAANLGPSIPQSAGIVREQSIQLGGNIMISTLDQGFTSAGAVGTLVVVFC